MKNNKGFTLVEVLAMLVVLGIIIGVTVPNITGILNNQKTNLIAEDGIKMIENAKNEFIVSEKVKYPEDGKCVIFTLDRLDKNSDIETGIENGKYNPVFRGRSTYDDIVPREEWSWGDIYKGGAIKYVFREGVGLVLNDGETE